MRGYMRVLIFALGSVLLLIGAVVVKFWYDDWQVEIFHAAHPMLKQMRNTARTNQRPNDPWPKMTDVLLSRVAPGTNRQDALSIMSSEGMNCASPPGPQKNTLLVCRLQSQPKGIPNWRVELTFNQDDRVSGGRVLMFKALSL